MSLQKITLPAFLITDWYANHLVLPETSNKQTIITKKQVDSQSNEWYLGNNLQHIVILVNSADAVYLPDEQLQFLSAILTACNKNMGDVAIVNLHQQPLLYAALKEKLQPAYLICFDVNAQDIQLSFSIPHYQLQAYDNCKFLFAKGLDKMLGAGDIVKTEKRNLWEALKKMFSL